MLYHIVSIATLSAVFILSVIIFFRVPKKRSNVLFLLFIFAVFIWLVSHYLLHLLDNYDYLLIILRLTFAISIVLLFFLFLFSLTFPKKIVKNFKAITLLVLIPTLLMICLTLSNLVVESFMEQDRVILANYGPGFLLFAIYTLINFLAIFFIFIYQHRTSDGLLKQQVRFLFFGIGVSASCVMIIDLFVPLFFENNVLSNYSPISVLFFLCFTTYAIIRHRLMDIRFIISRSLVYLALVACVATAFVFTFSILAYFVEAYSANQYIILIIFAFIIVIGIDPLKHAFAHITDRIFFKNQIDYNAELKRLSALINEEVALYSLISDLREVLMQSIKLKGADILIADEHNQQFLTITRPSQAGSVLTPQTTVAMADSNPLLKYLYTHQETLVTDEFNRYVHDLAEPNTKHKLHQALETLIQLKAGAVIPIIRDAKITGLLVIGRKNSGDIFSSEDINLFEVVASQLASALQRSKLYEQIQAFNVQLQKEVDKATAQLQQTNAELHLANEHLKELDSAKSEFISIASHQLRTPLAGITGYLSMILEGDYGKLNPQLNQVIKDIFEAGQRLVRLVNSFLDITKIEAGRISLNFSKVNLVELVAAEANELKPTADKKGISLVYVDPTQTDMMVEIDADKIRDVCLNLIDNAIKYTDHGTVTVALALQGPDHAHFWVQDTGVGIDPAKAHSLFQKFVRGTGIARVQPDGSGLGLFIVKKIVEAHHGKIWVDSAGPEQGSTFHVVLPLVQANK